MSSAVVVVVIIAIAVIVTLLTLTTVRGFFRAQRDATPHLADPSLLGRRVESFVGGARWPFGNASLPLARLDLHEYGVRLHGSVRALDSIVPDWQARYQDIAGSEPVASRMTVGRGLRLRVSPSNGWIIFWTTRPVGELSARLASAGVPVAWVPVRISFWTGRDV